MSLLDGLRLVPLALIGCLVLGASVRLRDWCLRQAATNPEVVAYQYGRCFRWLVLATWLAWLTTLAALSLDEWVHSTFTVSTLALAETKAWLRVLPAAFLLMCQIISYPEHVRLEPRLLRRERLVARCLTQQMAFFVIVHDWPTGATMSGWFLMGIGVTAVWLVLRALSAQWSWLQIMTARDELPEEALTLRARTLAERAGVWLRKISLIIVTAPRWANAFAFPGHALRLTDTMLEWLTEREVDFIVAHEVSHLRRHDLLKITTFFLILLTSASFLLWMLAQETSIPLNSEVAWGSLALVYLITFAFIRRIEYQADAAAVALIHDPEASIQALVKVARFNGFPLRGSSWETMLTSHPTTLQRAQTIAERAGWPPERLREILAPWKVQ